MEARTKLWEWIFISQLRERTEGATYVRVRMLQKAQQQSRRWSVAEAPDF
jgi:hypothetical protein